MLSRIGSLVSAVVKKKQIREGRGVGVDSKMKNISMKSLGKVIKMLSPRSTPRDDGDNSLPVPPGVAKSGKASPPPSPKRGKAKSAEINLSASAKEGKRMVIHNDPEEFSSDSTPLNAVPKSPETRTRLEESLRDHFLFTDMMAEDLTRVIDLMEQHEIEEGQDIIVQGDLGANQFFVIESGTADVLINGNKVGDYGPGGSFGELALMYNCERAATVRTTSKVVAWAMGLRTFRQLLASSASRTILQRCGFLRRIKLLEALTNEQVTTLAGALSSVTFEKDQYIIRQGATEDNTFYIIESGTVKCSQTNPNDPSGPHIPLMTLQAGGYFGEMALLLDEPRAANCIASGGPVSLLALEHSKFFELLGPLQEILQNNMRLRILHSVPLLSGLTAEELSGVAKALFVQSYTDGTYIIKQGEQGNQFYIINEGEVRCTVTDASGEKHLQNLTRSDYFGEYALLRNEPRSANVIASGNVDCLVLRREDFNSLLGPLEEILEREVQKRTALSNGAIGAAKPGRAIPFEDLTVLRTLGAGTFGRVKLVHLAKTGETFALKCMQKTQICATHQQRNVMTEKGVLYECSKFPFILNLVCTYNTPDQLMMLTELVQGGELWSYVYLREPQASIPKTAMGGFYPDTARFFVGSVVLCLQFLHQLSIAYRDLKPENLLIGNDGYLKMIDFGFAKKIPFARGNVMQPKSFTLCGTPDYLAPELVLSRGHDKSVDLWALGVFAYEMLVGKTPFADPKQSEIFRKAVRSDKFLVFPASFDPVAEDLIRRLLTPNPSFRLGNLSNGMKDVTSHAWFTSKQFSLDKLIKKELAPPVRPVLDNALDSRHFMQIEEDDTVPVYTGPQAVFEGF